MVPRLSSNSFAFRQPESKIWSTSKQETWLFVSYVFPYSDANICLIYNIICEKIVKNHQKHFFVAE